MTINKRYLLSISFGLMGASCFAGDLTIEGSLNVTSTSTSQGLCATNATLGTLSVIGPHVSDMRNTFTNVYGGALSILGLRVQDGANTLASGYASHASGAGASATNDNVFVWSDGTLFGSTSPCQFSAYARNGFKFFGGPIYGNGAGLTNLNLATAMSASITADKLASGSVTAAKLATGSVGSSAIAPGAITVANLAPGSVGISQAVIAEWNAWGNARYMTVTGSPDLILNTPGRSVAGYGMNIANISSTAYGASQRGYKAAGTQTIGPSAFGASQEGYNLGTQTIGTSAYGASQQGCNRGIQMIEMGAFGASQQGYNLGTKTIRLNAYGALQEGCNLGTQTIGMSAYGASQRGYVATDSTAINNGIGSVQLLNLTSKQKAYIAGRASIGLGACTVNHDQAIVAGDGLVSQGNGTITALGFFGNGAGLINLNLSTAMSSSITADKLASGSVTASKLATGSVGSSAIATGAVTAIGLASESVGTNKAIIAEWNAWGTARFLSLAGSSDLVLSTPGRSVAGIGMTIANISSAAYGASQHGQNSGTLFIGAAGAEQRGTVSTGATATNSGIGSIQLLNLTSGQTALITGHASIGLGACTVNHDQAIVAGDGLGSQGNGTITALGFFGNGAGLTNINFTGAVALNSVTADKLSTNAVTTEKITDRSVTVAKLVINDNLSMGGNRVTNLAAPLADEDAVTKAYLRAVLSALPPQGDLSMGTYTNGAPASTPLTF